MSSYFCIPVPYDEESGSDGKVSVYNVGDLGSIPGSGTSSGCRVGTENQVWSCVEEWNSTCLSSYSRGDRPLVELCLRGTFGVASRVPSTVSHFRMERGTSLEML